MPLIEGIGDEVTYFFIFLLVCIVVCLAWWTTSISEQRQLRTVFLIERRLRRQRTRSRLTNHTQSATLVEGTSNNSEVSTETLRSESMEPIASNKPPQASTSVEQQSTDETENSVDTEQNAIVETMDTDNYCVLRQRRLAFYDNRRDTLIDDTDSSSLLPNLSSADQISTSSSYDDMLDSEQVLMEHNYADHVHNESATDAVSDSFGRVDEITSRPEPTDQTHIRIKLKYINDTLRHVDGHLHELVGDFKRRHFETEISSNKLVRLIFNGKVLQQDTQTLQNCGLFDNCVVHCLVHNRRPNSNDTSSAAGIGSDDFAGASNRPRIPQMNNNNNNRESDLGNVLFAVISFILGSAWYFRYVYAHLYTVTATIALVAVTGIFTVVIIGMYFPDHETVPPRVDTSQR